MGVDGEKTHNNRFSIECGVLQVDVTSPLFFILALELILRRYDAADPGKGVSLADTMIHVLDYADDVVVLETGTDEGIRRLENRVNTISGGGVKEGC